MRLYNHLNQPIWLGEELGRGGEGTVYTLQKDTKNVAKVYHKAIAGEKVEKLKAMVVNSQDLSRFTAWPLATLHENPGGTIKGFVMPRVAGYREIHELYGPAHRKVQFPHADWSFLLHAARNVAAAFQAIHDCGHVIGDVNQSGILISQQAFCHLIDTDSFQIGLGNKVYSCEVGTPHFTPPELQGKSFRGIKRTENHDNFGLAVMIFQLLFMGRHPFAGRFLGTGDLPIEKAIQEYRFAFGARASTKQMAPPPNALDLTICTSSIAQLFERAFGEEAVHKGNRPRAKEWLNQLDALRSGLHSCSHNSAHKYQKNLSYCPWCQLEKASGTVYFLACTSAGQTQTRFNLEDVWSKIQAINMPSVGTLPEPNLIRVTPTPLPEYAKPPQGFLGFANIFFNFHDDKGERKKRESALRQAEQEWQDMTRQWQALNSDAGFNSIFHNLQNAYRECKNLPNQYQTERQEALLKIYLERFFLENAGIPHIGKKRALVLASYGIETASDISENRISSIPSFGSVLTKNLVEWRKTLESRFPQYRPSSRDLASLNSIDQKYTRKRSELESKLRAGKAQLEHRRDELIKKHDLVRQKAEMVAQKLAQARADLKAYD